ncbi:glycosyltransferase family 4 protein [Thiomicrorhabdus sp. 6S3-12]|uniref:glycosyltransferase family 4 protein n=1 Tax=Thiomicrorhabdus sp. 6S3-12 TaxID=2819681 RepID=UPI001AAE10BE|nr:glycosyltransferase family 4 protein [Thiomicrorhabdus sp. 6S3-12]MBO1922985.1 glycosyltransferase family 4 protein [Thiomicrorhabdus sp. 6S3-12]
MSKTVCIIGALPRSLINFRGELIKKILSSGYKVIAMAGGASAEEVSAIESLGVRYIDVPVERTSMNPFTDLKTMLFYRSIFEQEKPDFVLSYTIKPVIWGGIALRSLPKSDFTALVTGLGYAFEGDGFKRKVLRTIVSRLYKFALKRAGRVIFQNSDDLSYFVSHGLIEKAKAFVVAGSGIPLDSFQFQPLPKSDITFLMVARLLKEKGVYQYVDAACKVKKRFPRVRFHLLGGFDPSPGGIDQSQIDEWVADGCIEYLGETTDVRPFFSESHVFVLPSYYREGLPRTILEAMATGRPIITTDNVGCREPIVEGENGWLVPVQNSDALVEKMIWSIEHPEQLESMGRVSRKMAEENFDVHKINLRMLEIMELN